MTTAAELRAEAQRLRAFSHTVTEPAVLAEVHAMVNELERRLRAAENGGTGGT